ncbi:hypothetical protein AGDE_07254 [Angomonas deanei]|uniref:Lariat debranching enzyme, C-terminal domain containing protein, putative n=1 Tax=Angomonas deanei TaxID=59799 RepID=A0A7G2C431_9TRYP|nr:hypothetical protein AGDE_07254 [Angomonas deanei]CAD2214460.1 Lariat debranching enzyme, C-terminal domain containing protein, putative [Angomonas deanei]|eukprot:EPY35756.1 hypothetical protein AGDE_07254 [Angomonas deanei]
MRLFQPEWWFAAHLHCRFQATVQHDEDIHTGDRKTKFVALDKCTRDRGCGDFLDFIDVQVDDSDGEETTRGHHSTSYNTTDTILQRHPVWLRILKDAHPLVANNNVREFNVNNAFQETAVTTADGSDPTAALTRAMDAPNTFELLEALRLPPRCHCKCVSPTVDPIG